MDFIWSVLWVLTPTTVLALAFWFVIRNTIRVDSNERKAFQKIEAEERAKRAKHNASGEQA